MGVGRPRAGRRDRGGLGGVQRPGWTGYPPGRVAQARVLDEIQDYLVAPTPEFLQSPPAPPGPLYNLPQERLTRDIGHRSHPIPEPAAHGSSRVPGPIVLRVDALDSAPLVAQA